jgi:hypothetical protein
MRALTVIGAISVVAFAGACDQPIDHVAGPAAPVTAPVTAPVASATGAAPTAPPSSGPPSSGPPTSSSPTPAKAADPCPVSASTLYTALRTSEIFARAGKPDGLAKPSCSRGFAYARSTFTRSLPAGHGEIPWILFAHDGSWKAVNLGTGDVCGGYVTSQATRDRLNKGTGGGC